MPPRAQPIDPKKLLPPILRLLTPESGSPDAYSAHQKARTTAARLINSGHNDAAIEVLFGSAKELLKLGEAGSGCDLTVYLLGVYRDAEVEVTSESRGECSERAHRVRWRSTDFQTLTVLHTQPTCDFLSSFSKDNSTTSSTNWPRCMAKKSGRFSYQVNE